jgi:hypothetical protein
LVALYLRRRVEKRLYIARVMQHTDDLDAILPAPVEHNIVAHGQAPQTGGEFVPPPAHSRLLGQGLALLVNGAEQPVRGRDGAFLGEVNPDFE